MQNDKKSKSLWISLFNAYLFWAAVFFIFPILAFGLIKLYGIPFAWGYFLKFTAYSFLGWAILPLSLSIYGILVSHYTIYKKFLMAFQGILVIFIAALLLGAAMESIPTENKVLSAKQSQINNFS